MVQLSCVERFSRRPGRNNPPPPARHARARSARKLVALRRAERAGHEWSDEAAFEEYYKDMPWLALPYAQRDLKNKLSKKFKVSGIPSLVGLLKSAGKHGSDERQGAEQKRSLQIHVAGALTNMARESEVLPHWILVLLRLRFVSLSSPLAPVHLR